MKSITQFWTDVSYRAIVSPNGRFVIKHSKEENYEGYDEIFLLYDTGNLLREINGENCLFIGNEFVLKFPFVGYCSEGECMELTLFRLKDNTKSNLIYPKIYELILCARTAFFYQREMKVYFFSNVRSEFKDYTKYLYCLDLLKLIDENIVSIFESSLDFIPNNSYLEIFNHSLFCFDNMDEVKQLKLPLSNIKPLIPFQNMETFIIQPNEYLKKTTQAYYRYDYTTFGTVGNPDFLNHLKNQFGNTNVPTLQNAVNELKKTLESDLPKIKNLYSNTNLTVCVIPRAKAEGSYSDNQKLFKRVITSVVDKLSGLANGTNYIIRQTNTRTTHMNRSGYGGDGDMPYVGITKATCIISSEVGGKDILLIDDIYTKGVNIDEDAIQALLESGARSVIFYSVAKTYKGGI